ncbi:MAG: thiamine pyrophosphate-binding protein [Gomphosphaeria aponina SAG 52.96 = DSM 107014]|uniref:Thiamine pyrophosphate-binding protein n=1 Tax=Gomphosphaeria aponina SAG 52.96 = DSM 107014 TaxID=1521640 RepID=A0A941GWW5_9CHRO|nr:thiamine pyrophosphate-binding protein [Gomphosphaeria aponina SAG 52.96 = DSM 107014]
MLTVVILCLNMRKLIVTLSGADFVIKYLAAYQVKYAFFVPGYLIDPLLESLTNSDAIAPIICNSELGSGYIADGYARASKNIGLCLSTGGPGASNLITAAFNAKEDESAVFFITGNVPNNLRNIGGFQDVDALQIFQHNVSYSTEINDPEKLNAELNNAFVSLQYSTPVHLSIPLDIQNHIYKSPPVIPQIESCLSQEELTIIDSTAAKINEVLSQNTKICLLAGQRLRNSSSILLQFAEKFNIPIATTAAAKGIFPETHPLSLGTFSINGHLRAKQTLLSKDIEVLLLVGLDFNQQESLQWEADLCAPQRQIIRIDHHPAKCLSQVKINLDLVVANCSLVLRKIIEQNSNKPHPNPPLSKGREPYIPSISPPRARGAGLFHFTFAVE